MPAWRPGSLSVGLVRGGGPLSPSLGQQGCRKDPEPQARGHRQREARGRVALSLRFLSASSFPDELTWIIDLLEKDSVSFQETLGDPGPAGENALSLCPCPSPDSALLGRSAGHHSSGDLA